MENKDTYGQYDRIIKYCKKTIDKLDGAIEYYKLAILRANETSITAYTNVDLYKAEMLCERLCGQQEAYMQILADTLKAKEIIRKRDEKNK